jgi:transposase
MALGPADNIGKAAPKIVPPYLRRLMTTPGVGPVVALTYRAPVDVPARLRKSKAVGAVFGLTCSKYQSGEIDRSGRISRCGDEMMRVMLYEAAQSMLRSKKWSWLKAWATQIARRRGMKKAIVALARRLAVSSLNEGQHVEFEIEDNRGKTSAVNLRAR